jgi:hypothetical protein
MATGTAVDAGGASRGDVPPRRSARWPTALAAGSAAVGAVGLLLPWWRAGPGPVLLGTGPLRELPADAWTGIEVAGPRAVVVAALAVAAVVAVAADSIRPGPAGRVAAAASAGAGLACAGAALAGWGPTGASGLWVTLTAGLAGLGSALLPPRRQRHRPGAGPPDAPPAGDLPQRPPQTSPPRVGLRGPLVPAAAVLAAAVTLAVPGGPTPPGRTASGPFVPVAALGPWPLRSGAPGLAGRLDEAWPVAADGAAGVVTGSGIVVADGRRRARVLARTDRGAPAPLGVAGDRVARWAGPDSVAVTGLRADGGLAVVVHDVAVTSRVGTDGSIWLRSDLDPPETVRRLDLAERSGEQVLSATYLPVVTIQEPDGEGPVDVRAVLPVPGGALRVVDAGGTRRLERLTGTAAGIAVSPVYGCGPSGGSPGPAFAASDVRAVTTDGTGVWFPGIGTDGDRLVHLAPDGTLRVVEAPLPGQLVALAESGDGSLLLTARDRDGDTFWRLPDPQAALSREGVPPGCTPAR